MSPNAGRVLVVGQIARDLVLRVDAAPGAGGTTPVRERLEMLGGKGANQAVGMAQLGLEPILLGIVGDDAVGGELIARARADGIDVGHVVRRTATRTGLITSVVDQEGWRYCEDLPEAVLVSPEDLDGVAALFSAVDAVVLQLQQPAATVRRAAELAREAGARVVLDGAPPQGDPLKLMRLADVVRADAREATGLATLLGTPAGSAGIRDGPEGLRVARSLLDLGPSFAAVGAGKDGDAFAWPDSEVVIPFTDSHVVDTTGAGDAMVAALVAGDQPLTAARRASAAAGLAVQRLGGRPAMSEEVLTGTAGRTHSPRPAGRR